MTDEKEPLLLEHEADGIRELDNQLPRWWILLFYITIVFAAGYLAYFHVFHIGDGQAERYEKEVARAEHRIAMMRARQAETSGPVAYEVSTEASVLEMGAATYKKHCSVCHGAAGQGLVGPNLTDDYWVHGGDYVDTIKVIQEGVVAKGMVPWKRTLRGAQIQEVASYIYSLRGTTPPEPKAPEGDVYTPDDA